MLEVVQFVEQMAAAVEPFFERIATANPSVQAAQTLRAQIDAVNEKIEAGNDTLADRIKLTRLLHQLETAEAGIPDHDPITIPINHFGGDAPATGGDDTGTPATAHRFDPEAGFLAAVAKAHQDKWLGATKASDSFIERQKEIADINRQLQGLAVQTGADFATAFAAAASGAQSFSDAMRDLAAALAACRT